MLRIFQKKFQNSSLKILKMFSDLVLMISPHLHVGCLGWVLKLGCWRRSSVEYSANELILISTTKLWQLIYEKRGADFASLFQFQNRNLPPKSRKYISKSVREANGARDSALETPTPKPKSRAELEYPYPYHTIVDPLRVLAFHCPAARRSLPWVSLPASPDHHPPRPRPSHPRKGGGGRQWLRKLPQSDFYTSKPIIHTTYTDQQ